MRKAGKARAPGKKGVTHTVCYIDEHWQAIVAGAARAGKSVSSWWVSCALHEDPSAKGPGPQPLVLNAEKQRAIADTMAELAAGLDAEGVASLQAHIRALVEEPLQRMVQEGRRERAMELLREVFGAERAAVIAAAFIPVIPDTKAAPDKPAKPAPGSGDDTPPPPQPDLFGR